MRRRSSDQLRSEIGQPRLGGGHDAKAEHLGLHRPVGRQLDGEPQPTQGGDFPLSTLLPFNLWNQTVRRRLRLSLGEHRLRIVLSDEYGAGPLTIDAIHCALPSAEGLVVDAVSNTPVTFNEDEQVVIPAGASAIAIRLCSACRL